MFRLQPFRAKLAALAVTRLVQGCLRSTSQQTHSLLDSSMRLRQNVSKGRVTQPRAFPPVARATTQKPMNEKIQEQSKACGQAISKVVSSAQEAERWLSRVQRSKESSGVKGVATEASIALGAFVIEAHEASTKAKDVIKLISAELDKPDAKTAVVK